MFYDPKWEKPVIEPWRKALFDAADLLEKDGWTRIQFENKAGNHCAVGAINKVTIGSSYDYGECNPIAKEAIAKLRAEINRRWFSLIEYGRVTSWNDGMTRSKREVIRTMRRAARR